MNEIDRVTKMLRNAQADAPEQAHEILYAVAEGIQSEIQDAAPKKTGEMANSIHVEWKDPLTLEITGNAVAGFVEFGTKPHDIYPRKAEFLVFQTKDGRWVKTKKVRHPGTPPRPFIQPVVSQVMASLGDKLGAMGTALLQRKPRD